MTLIMECFAKYFELGFLNIKDIKPSRKSREIVTSCESGVRALALTPPGVFGDLLNLQGFKPSIETLARCGPHSR